MECHSYELSIFNMKVNLIFKRELRTFVIHLNETVEGSTCLISKTSLI